MQPEVRNIGQPILNIQNPDPVTPNLQIIHLDVTPDKTNIYPARCKNQPTTPDSDKSNGDNEMDTDSQHNILYTPQSLSTPSIYARESTPFEKYCYPPSLSSSSDDGSTDAIVHGEIHKIELNRGLPCIPTT